MPLATDRALASLALLKVNWDRLHQDYVENFIPFVAECLRQSTQREISLAELQESLQATFGLSLPQGALKTVLGRAVRRGYVRKDHGVYIKEELALDTVDFSRAREDVFRKYEALAQRLAVFCRSRFNLPWSNEEAKGALLTYVNEQAVPIVSASFQGIDVLPAGSRIKHGQYVVNAFVHDLLSRDPEGFSFLETIVKGEMLASALLYPDMTTVPRKFRRTEVYFDTGFLLRALGLHGTTLKSFCRELIDLLFEQNADLRCFEHTFQEVSGVLGAAAAGLRTGAAYSYRPGDVMDYFVKNGYTTSDVELVIARLEKSLRTLHIQVKQKPPFEERLGVDEAALRNELQDGIRYKRTEALTHDVECLTAIYRLRKAGNPVLLEECGALFVTTNAPLVTTSARFFSSQHQVADVPIAVQDHALTTLVWLKKPLKAPDLPRRRIIADCYAALNPPDQLWKRYVDEVEKLKQVGGVSPDDYHLLRHAIEARNILMDATLGDPAAFTESSIKEILERARMAVRAEVEEKYESERERRAMAERRAEESEEARSADKSRRLERLGSIAEQIAKSVSWITTGAIATCCVVVIVVGVRAIACLRDNCPPWLLWIVGVVAAIVAIFDVANGYALRTIRRLVQLKVQRFCEVFLVRIFGA